MGVDTQALAREMERLAAPYQHALSSLKEAPCPLIGGWVGSLAYEFGYAREAKLQGLVPELPLPLMFAGLYLWFASEDLTAKALGFATAVQADSSPDQFPQSRATGTGLHPGRRLLSGQSVPVFWRPLQWRSLAGVHGTEPCQPHTLRGVSAP